MKDAPSIDPAEIAKFSAMAEEWWDPDGKFAPLHKFQPIRRRFIREWSARHFSRLGATSAEHPFAGLRLLDIGCGGGLMAEPMAQCGFSVTGIDASEKNIAAARLHAEKSGLAIAYRHATAEALAAEAADGGPRFDLVLNLEVVEHVADLKGYLNAAASLVAPGGAMIVATLNKTLKSLALAKIGAEYVLRWLPKGSHDWSRFVPPETLRPLLSNAGLTVQAVQGVAFDPLSWEWALSGDISVNYMMVAVRPA